ncbi:hypothetical protein Vretimale_678 [Volvox reticuliferus]|uniref:Uncharacterized protein n=1 Tax=Volvox reticuliferus TaxID=1737510 RepID=A0A8J4D3U3_9CHLO|nr:hypothetical protein Vretimale_678 [Volvox reticuliferus]
MHLGLECNEPSRTVRDAAPAGPEVGHAGAGPGAAAAFSKPAEEEDIIDIPRLYRRLQTYAAAYDIPSHAVRQMEELIATPIAVRLLQLPRARLHDFLVLDAYKPKMHVMYDKYLSGVTADFALTVRWAPPPADPAALPSRHPDLWAAFEASAAALSRTTPYTPYEVQALRTQFGTELPQALLDRCHEDGVAAVEWQESRYRASSEEEKKGMEAGGQQEAGKVAVASGPLISASLMETPLMQRFQQLAVEAQVEALRNSRLNATAGDTRRPQPPPPAPSPASTSHSSSQCSGPGANSSSGCDGSQPPGPPPQTEATSPQPHSTASRPAGESKSGSGSRTLKSPQTHALAQPGHGGRALESLFDRTERLANSLAQLVITVERINGLKHGCRVALFAGRRSSDLLYLLIQNLYCAVHLDGYGGTSSLYVVAVLGREWTSMGLPERECWGGVGRLVGTHAHEQVGRLRSGNDHNGISQHSLDFTPSSHPHLRCPSVRPSVWDTGDLRPSDFPFHLSLRRVIHFRPVGQCAPAAPRVVRHRSRPTVRPAPRRLGDAPAGASAVPCNKRRRRRRRRRRDGPGRHLHHRRLPRRLPLCSSASGIPSGRRGRIRVAYSRVRTLLRSVQDLAAGFWQL